MPVISRRVRTDASARQAAEAIAIRGDRPEWCLLNQGGASKARLTFRPDQMDPAPLAATDDAG